MSAGGGAGGGNIRAAAAAATGAALEWKFSQVFGERAPGEEVQDGLELNSVFLFLFDSPVDVISAIEFEGKGNYLATGDHGGRVVLFERSDKKERYSRKKSENCDYPDTSHPKYMYKTEFQSHEPEFDYLKSLEIEEKINKLRWCAAPNSSLLILSANNRTIKLWKVLDKKVKKIKEMVLDAHVHSENGLLADQSFMIGRNASSIPNGHYPEWGNETPDRMSSSAQGHQSVISSIEDATSTRCRKIYSHAHDYNINSLSNNSDGESFISADDLRINLWNLEISNQCFNIIDMKPPDMEDLVEVITSAEFHPVYCNILAYSSSRGFIRLVDMRQSALCDKNARILQDHEAHGSRSFFTEIIASISDIKFARDGVHILSRDFMNLKLWDLRMDVSPIATYRVHEYLRPKLHELYNNDSIFDKFECCLSGDGLHFATGSYSNMFRVFSRNNGNEDGASLQASRNPNRILNSQPALKATRLLHSFTRSHTRRGNDSLSSDISHGLPCDLSSKLSHLAWHPTTNLIACAAVNSLYLYYA